MNILRGLETVERLEFSTVLFFIGLNSLPFHFLSTLLQKTQHSKIQKNRVSNEKLNYRNTGPVARGISICCKKLNTKNP
jgi:hypothetical protein